MSNNLQDYVSQDVRTVNIRTNLVPGYPVSRWAPKLLFNTPSVNVLGYCVAVVRNLNQDGEGVVLRFQEVDGTPSGVRTNLGDAISVAPGGTRQVAFTPTKPFVELKGIYGDGPVWIELMTRADWTQVGFSAKTDSSYPEVLYAADPASPAATAEQAFTLGSEWNIVHNLGYIATPTLFDSNFNDITALATITNETVNGYVANFSDAHDGFAFSTK